MRDVKFIILRSFIITICICGGGCFFLIFVIDFDWVVTAASQQQIGLIIRLNIAYLNATGATDQTAASAAHAMRVAREHFVVVNVIVTLIWRSDELSTEAATRVICVVGRVDFFCILSHVTAQIFVIA